MATRIVFGILAHDHLDAVTELVGNLATTCPSSQAIVFDSGPDPRWRAGGDFRVARASRPLRHAYVSEFHYGVMQEITEGGLDYDCFVTLDSDVLIIKEGFEARLSALLARFAYLGVGFAPVDPRGEWRVGRRFMYHWDYWRALLAAEVPYGAFNPVQVFRRDVVDALVADPGFARVVDAARTAKTWCLEEVLYPTVVVARGFAASALPGRHAITMRRYARPELEVFAADPDVFVVHKVGMGREDADRRLILELARRSPTDADTERPLPAPLATAPRPRGRTAGVRALLRETAGDVRALLRGP